MHRTNGNFINTVEKVTQHARPEVWLKMAKECRAVKQDCTFLVTYLMTF